MTRFDEQAFVERIRRRLDVELGDLDSATLARLETARKLALAQAGPTTAVAATGALHDPLSRRDTLPPEIESRLDAIRQRAVTRLQAGEAIPAQRQPRNSLASLFNDRPWLTGMVTAAFVAVTTTSILLLNSPPDSLSLEAELALVASATDIELYENLDFYLWLAENGLSN